MTGLRQFLDFLCPPSPAEIARERKALIDKRRREALMHRPVVEIDQRLRELTHAQLRQNRKRMLGVRA